MSDLLRGGAADRYFDKEGRPLGMFEWARLVDDHKYKRIALTELPDCKVSTVWLGLNHQFLPGGPIHIFETMVFRGALDGETDRYSTEQEALAGHKDMVRRAKAKGE